MEHSVKISEAINTLIVKNTDLHHLYLSLANIAKADLLKGLLKSHADKHRVMNLELVGALKACLPDAVIDLEGSLAGGLAKGWEEIKKTFSLESDEDIRENLTASHAAVTKLYEEINAQTTFNNEPLQAVIDAHLEWMHSISF